MENRRSLPKIVVNSRAQLRTAVPFFILLALACATFTVSFWEVIPMISPDASATMMWSAMVGMSVMGIVSLMLWLVVSHRIFGPTVPIRRHINSLCDGNYDSQISLRKHDEFHDIADDLNRLSAVLKNQRGETLISLIVSVGIMGILLLAMASMFQIQSKESRALTEKLAATDLYRNLSITLGNASTCFGQLASSNLSSPDALSFDATTVSSDSPYVIELNSIAGAGGGPTLVSLGGTASAMAPSLKIAASAGIELSVTSATTANLLINFDQSALVRPIHNIVVPVTLQTTGTATAATITGCGGSGNGTGGGTMLAFGNVAGPHTTTSVMCPSNTHLIGCVVRAYSANDGQGYPELQQPIYLDSSGNEAGSYENVSGGRAPTSSIINPQGCSYYDRDNQDSAQVAATCM